MRNVLSAAVLLLLATPMVRGQGAWADKLFAGALRHDFGSQPRGAQLYHRFKFTNLYAVDLKVTNVRTSCGCVTVTPCPEPIGPRQEGYVDVLMDTRRFTGHKTVSIYVTVGPEYVSTATLQVSAYSRADVVFNPGHVSFGVVTRGQAPRQSIDVEYAGVLNWQVSEVVNHSRALEATVREMYRRPGQVGYRIEVTLRPDAAPAGPFKEDLLLRTNDPASPLVPVLVEATIQAPLSVSPSTVALGSVRTGETVSRKVIVRGSKPFRVVAIDGLGNGLSADLPSSPGLTQVITLRCQATGAGEIRRRLQILTDLAGETPVPVLLEGTATQ